MTDAYSVDDDDDADAISLKDESPNYKPAKVDKLSDKSSPLSSSSGVVKFYAIFSTVFSVSDHFLCPLEIPVVIRNLDKSDFWNF